MYSFGTTKAAGQRTGPGQPRPIRAQCHLADHSGKRDQGRTIVANEAAKYLGLPGVRRQPARAQVGSWEIPLSSTPTFWVPPDPGCEGKCLMHADAELKGYQERLVFRAPPAGTGPITFRVLVKQGETNKGAFYWPVAPASGSLTPPAWGTAGSDGDLTLSEAPDDAASAGGIEWISSYARGTNWVPQRCSDVRRVRADVRRGLAAVGRVGGVLAAKYRERIPLRAAPVGWVRSVASDVWPVRWLLLVSRHGAVPGARGWERLIVRRDAGGKPRRGHPILRVRGGAAGRRRLRQVQEQQRATVREEEPAMAACQREAKVMRVAAELTEARVAAAGGCPNAKLALRRAESGSGSEASLLASAAACPQHRAAALVAHGGDTSDGALTADDELDNGRASRPPLAWRRATIR